MPSNIHVFPSPEVVAQKLSERIVLQIRKTINQKKICTLLLSGGTTPKLLYQNLAQSDVQWSSVHIFLSDERFVPMDSSESNFRMISEMFVDKIQIPKENVHPILTEFTTKEEVAENYEKELRAIFSSDFREVHSTVSSDHSALDSHLHGNDMIMWDINILGIGEDCHTAALFPHTKSLHEKEKWVIGVTAQNRRKKE